MIKNTFTIFFCCCLCAFGKSTHAQLPQIYSIAPATANKAKQNATPEKLKQLQKQAEKFMNKSFGSVMDKKFTPPCGNMHEYMSMAKYYWPDPSKPGGKPYIRKDGQKNPDNDLVSDDKNFDNLIDAVHILSWTYYFTGVEKYAAKSAELMRFWFIDTATYMMPNMNHAQVRTGIDSGVSTGIIDSHGLPRIVDAIGLVRSSKSWSAADESGMKSWFTQYLQWLRTSDHGKKEAKAKNNHGSFYDVQAVCIALYCGDKTAAAHILDEDKKRLAWQVEPDGRQPLELERTLGLSYSTFNLEAWTLLCNAAETQGIDLWRYETGDGRSIRKAIDFLVPYTTQDKPWPYQQISPYKTSDFYKLLLVAAEKYNDDRYKTAAAKIRGTGTNVLTALFYEQ